MKDVDAAAAAGHLMGDARLLRVAAPVQRFDTAELHALIADMFDTREAANGAGLEYAEQPAEGGGANFRIVCGGRPA